VTTLILARHGETDWNRDGIWQGHGDPPLNAVGREQAAALAESLRETALSALYSSDLRRALETAEIVSETAALSVVARPGLREIDVGSWTGLTLAEIAERYPDMDYHDGESREAFDVRVRATLAEIGRAHDGQAVLVVTHGGVVRSLQRALLGEPLDVLPNGGTYAVRWDGDAFVQE
jgi:2,3-bisphosphoglycerate-dependent phosphoglycerate mutase